MSLDFRIVTTESADLFSLAQNANTAKSRPASRAQLPPANMSSERKSPASPVSVSALLVAVPPRPGSYRNCVSLLALMVLDQYLTALAPRPGGVFVLSFTFSNLPMPVLCLPHPSVFQNGCIETQPPAPWPGSFLSHNCSSPAARTWLLLAPRSYALQIFSRALTFFAKTR